MILCENVNKSFDGRAVLKDFSLHLKKGERVCLMGASGSGKTTVINLLLGLILPDSGKVVCGESSAVFQENRLCEDFSAVTNVKIVTKDKDKKRAESLLSDLLLSDDMYKKVRDFSGGMKRRTAIARALAYDKDIILLDEPFKGLDTETRAVVAEVINRETAGKTLLFVSHDKKEAELLGARIVEM